MPVSTTLKGMRNRDFSSVSTVPARYISGHIRTLGSTAPVPTGAIFRDEDDEDLVVLGFRASVDNAAAGITTLTANLNNASGSMLIGGAMSIKGYNQQVRQGIILTTNNVIAAGEVYFVTIASSNNENVFNVSWVIKVRPFVGAETRVL